MIKTNHKEIEESTIDPDILEIKKKRLLSASRERMKHLSIPPKRRQWASARKWIEDINKTTSSPQGTRLKREKEYFYISFKNCKTILRARPSIKQTKDRNSKM